MLHAGVRIENTVFPRLWHLCAVSNKSHVESPGLHEKRVLPCEKAAELAPNHEPKTAVWFMPAVVRLMPVTTISVSWRIRGLHTEVSSN